MILDLLAAFGLAIIIGVALWFDAQFTQKD